MTFSLKPPFSYEKTLWVKSTLTHSQLAVDLRILKMQLDIRGHTLNATDSVKIDHVERALDSEKVIGKRIDNEGQR